MGLFKIFMVADKHINHGIIHYLYRFVTLTALTLLVGGFWLQLDATSLKLVIIGLWSLMLLFYGWVLGTKPSEDDDDDDDDTKSE